MTKFDLEFFKRATAEDGSVILSDEVIDYIETRAIGDAVPACRVCGGELSIQSAGGGRATEYACIDIPRLSEGYTNDEREAYWKHYADSKWTQFHSGDAFVLALVQDYRKLKTAQ